MSNHVFPTLPGISIEIDRAPIWNSIVHRSASGRSVGLSPMFHPNWRYKLRFEFLRAGAEAELQAIVGLFNKLHGRSDTFLFLDDTDKTATSQVIGTGNGVTTAFRLYREYGGFLEPVLATHSIASVYVGAALVSPANYSVSAGVITFSTPPANGATISWTGVFYWRCRFDYDELNASRFLQDLWKADSVSFTTEKP